MTKTKFSPKKKSNFMFLLINSILLSFMLICSTYMMRIHALFCFLFLTLNLCQYINEIVIMFSHPMALTDTLHCYSTKEPYCVFCNGKLTIYDKKKSTHSLYNFSSYVHYLTDLYNLLNDYHFILKVKRKLASAKLLLFNAIVHTLFFFHTHRRRKTTVPVC